MKINYNDPLSANNYASNVLCLGGFFDLSASKCVDMLKQW